MAAQPMRAVGKMVGSRRVKTTMINLFALACASIIPDTDSRRNTAVPLLIVVTPGNDRRGMLPVFHRQRLGLLSDQLEN